MRPSEVQAEPFPLEAGTRPQGRRSSLFFLTLAGLYVLYSLVFIFQSSLQIDGQRYFCLFDDQMISMRFAAHFAEGLGLTWNPGEYVEGFSNPLWTLYMAFWHWLGIPAATISLPIQLTGLALSLATLWCVRGLCEELGLRREVGVSAVLFVGLYYPLNYWVLLGTEVGVLACIVAAGTLLSLRMVRSHASPVPLYVLLGLSLWVRVDAFVPAVVLIVWNAWCDRERRGTHWRIGLAWIALSLALQTIVRLWYFGELLPNTYYLKVEGIPLDMRIFRGLLVLTALIVFSGPVLFAAMGLAVARATDRRWWLLGALCAGQAAYSVYVGGDVWEFVFGANRFLSVVAPLGLILLAIGLWKAVAYFERSRPRVAVVGGGLLGILLANAFSRWSIALPLPAASGDGAWTMVCVGAGVLMGVVVGRTRPSALRLRLLYGFTCGIALLSLNSHLRVAPGQASTDLWVKLAPPPYTEDLALLVRLARFLDGATTEEATLSVTWAGALPYFSDRRAFDFLGKSDKLVARLPPRLTSVSEFIPGHNKWSYQHTFGLIPDVVVQVWPSPVLLGRDAAPPPEARPYLAEEYVSVVFEDRQFWVRKGSSAIRWDRLPPEAVAGSPADV